MTLTKKTLIDMFSDLIEQFKLAALEGHMAMHGRQGVITICVW